MLVKDVIQLLLTLEQNKDLVIVTKDNILHDSFGMFTTQGSTPYISRIVTVRGKEIEEF